MGRRWLALACALVMSLGVGAAGGSAGDERPPQDYTAVEGLSQPEHETRLDSTRVAVRDGVEIALDIHRPVTDGRWPAILVLSPYHGTLDDRSAEGFLGPDDDREPVSLASYFSPRGYATVFADLRGTGRSTGCLQLLGEEDRADAFEVVEWIAAQPWSNGRVGMVGHSYPAYAAIAAASVAPPSLVTIVASAGGAHLYPHQFQQGVPYHDQPLGPLATYQALATAGYATEAAGKRPLDAGCEWQSSTALHTDHVSGVETEWHRARDFRTAAADAHIPVFASYGTDDGAVNLQALDWFTDRGGREGDKLWIGQWTHGYVSVGGESYPYPNDREEQWRAAVHAWLDRHLQQRPVETGPPVEVFLNGGQVLVAAAWPLTSDTVALYPSGAAELTGALDPEPGAPEVASFTASPPGLSANALRFETAPAQEPLLLLGTPVLHLRAALDGQRVNLVARLSDVAPNGSAVSLHPRGFAINPELRNGVSQVSPVVAGEVMDLRMIGVGVAHRLLPGHRLRLDLTTPGSFTAAANDYAPVFGYGATVDVHLGGAQPTRLDLPVLPAPRLWDDPR